MGNFLKTSLLFRDNRRQREIHPAGSHRSCSYNKKKKYPRRGYGKSIRTSFLGWRGRYEESIILKKGGEIFSSSLV
jgi:hypothetical protein